MLVVPIVAIVLLTATAAIYLGLRETPLCDSHLCEHYAHLLNATLSRSVHPCEDFHGYVCEGWERTMPVSVKADMTTR